MNASDPIAAAVKLYARRLAAMRKMMPLNLLHSVELAVTAHSEYGASLLVHSPESFEVIEATETALRESLELLWQLRADAAEEARLDPKRKNHSLH